MERNQENERSSHHNNFFSSKKEPSAFGHMETLLIRPVSFLSRIPQRMGLALTMVRYC